MKEKEKIIQKLSEVSVIHFIATGIMDSGCSSEDLKFLSVDDFDCIGEALAKRKAIRSEMVSVGVRPRKQTLGLLIDHEGVDFSDENFRRQASAICTIEEYPEKEIFFVPVVDVVMAGGEQKYVNQFGLKLFENPVPYLAEIAYGLLKHNLLATGMGEDGLQIAAVMTEDTGLDKNNESHHLLLCMTHFFGRGFDGQLVRKDTFWKVDPDMPTFFLAEKLE